ncbi:MAG: response regulator, partial [Candidatus Nomurabacteria bacterium]|nr:response regulator [Candidatus Nomurabacteria bacterium]
MTKILLVEDDRSLREIYGVRLLAEGYDIISASDGEEALAVAIRENPDLIVSDVMMPKMSGFEMLDLLRSNDATKNIKVIMMTALSSDQQRDRGERLGADRYLVKSQVGIEDLVAAVHEVLNDKNGASQPAAAAIQPMQSPINTQAATLPSAATNTPAPTLPPRPMSVSTVTDPLAVQLQQRSNNPFAPSSQPAVTAPTAPVQQAPVAPAQPIQKPVAPQVAVAPQAPQQAQAAPNLPTAPQPLPPAQNPLVQPIAPAQPQAPNIPQQPAQRVATVLEPVAKPAQVDIATLANVIS